MIYFLILPTRKFIHTHCIRTLGLLNANTCDHPRCSLLFFNPYSPPLSCTLYLFCTLQFGCISIGWFVSTPDLFLVFALHFLIFASLLMFLSLQFCVWNVHKTPGWWLVTAATCLLGREQPLSTKYKAITMRFYSFAMIYRAGFCYSSIWLHFKRNKFKAVKGILFTYN
jgi:hypothetical protein